MSNIQLQVSRLPDICAQWKEIDCGWGEFKSFNQDIINALGESKVQEIFEKA